MGNGSKPRSKSGRRRHTDGLCSESFVQSSELTFFSDSKNRKRSLLSVVIVASCWCRSGSLLQADLDTG